uniref:Uncharacterized protein n=1 Tax=Arundo donax TaxID=35708 RepID=A0A0A8XTR0_ARUDO
MIDLTHNLQMLCVLKRPVDLREPSPAHRSSTKVENPVVDFVV